MVGHVEGVEAGRGIGGQRRRGRIRDRARCPSRSMSATCQRPVTMRVISSPGASSVRAGRAAATAFTSAGVPCTRSRLPSTSGRRWRPRHSDPPEAERAGDVAVLVEVHRADDAFIPIGLPSLISCSAGELVLAGMDHLAAGFDHLADRIADGGGLDLAGMRDGEADDGAGVIGAVGGGARRLEAAERLVVLVKYSVDAVGRCRTRCRRRRSGTPGRRS